MTCDCEEDLNGDWHLWETLNEAQAAVELLKTENAKLREQLNRAIVLLDQYIDIDRAAHVDIMKALKQ